MASQKHKTTVSDIAKRAGVSAATVSRVLNNVDYPVREEVRGRVLEAATQLNYKPNVFSQMLKGGASQEIGVIVPSITNPFYAELVSAVESECLQRGYMPITCCSHNNTVLEKRHLENLEKKHVDGILLSGMHLDEAQITAISSGVKGLVLFDQISPGYSHDCVSFDFFAGGYMATNYLLECGHKDIAFLSGPIDRPSREQYFNGYRKALKDAGVRLNNRRVVLYDEIGEYDDTSVKTDYRSGWELGRMLMNSDYLPDALVVVNDMMAIGVIKYLEQQGVHIPRDISIIGFDDISFSALVSPALTTIAQPASETGRLATRILLDRIEGACQEPQRIILEPTLVERESVRKLHKKIKK